MMFRSVARRLTGRKVQPSAPVAVRGQTRAARPCLEGLEARDTPALVFVVAQGSATDASHFSSLTDALAAAGTNGTVLVEPGAAPDAGTVTVTQSGVTIKADTSQASPYFTPLYSLDIEANGVVLTNLNLQDVTIGAGFGNTQILNSTVSSITEDTLSGTASQGGNIIAFDRVLNAVSLTGTPGGAGDLIEYNVFNGSNAENDAGTTNALLSLTDDGNTTVLDNDFGNAGTFGPAGALGQLNGGTTSALDAAVLGPPAGTASPVSAISITGTTAGALTGDFVQGNTITVQGTSTASFGVSVTTSATAAASVLVGDNSISTGAGTGLLIDAGNDATTAVTVEGNNFNGNAVGVSYVGAGGGTIASDLGGGSLGSTGNNVFASFTASATAGAAAISVSGAGTGAVLSAQNNVFGTATPSAVVFGAGGANVANPLTGNSGFVQTLYVEILGRIGSTAELQNYTSQMSSGGLTQAQVVTDILNSTEALDRTVNQIYIDCLGRTGSTAELTPWATDIQSGTTLEQVIADIVTSTEWQQKNPGSPIAVYYENQLHRNAAPNELAYWQGVLQKTALPAVPLGIDSSAEFHQDFALTVLTQMLNNSGAASQAEALAANPSLNLLQIETDLFNQDSIPGV